MIKAENESSKLLTMTFVYDYHEREGLQQENNSRKGKEEEE